MNEITQAQLNSILLNLQEILTIKHSLTLTNTLNDFCELSFEMGENKANVHSGDEYIILNSININLSELVFSIFNYSIVLKYYRLNSDMDNADTSFLIEKEFTLVEGDNEISFEEYPIYLQEDFDLLIKK